MNYAGMPTITVDDGWHLKVDNGQGRVWVKGDEVRFYRWVNGNLLGLDANGDPWKSLT